MKLVNVGIIGAGHLGTFHARWYAELANANLVGVFDLDPSRAERLASRWGGRVFEDLDDLLTMTEAVSVAVPTVSHHAVVLQALRRDVDVLVEKPIAVTLAEADEMISEAKARGRILQVGHIERFNPAFQALGSLPVNPRFIEVHRLAPFTVRGTDVAVILDLMIHDLDLILKLVRDELVSVEAVGVSVISDSEDLTNARLVFAKGCVANVTASRISTKAMRKMRIFQSNAYIVLDFLARTLDVYRLKPGIEPMAPDEEMALEIEGASDRIVLRRPRVLEEDPLKAELAAFLRAVQTRQQPAVSGEDGRRALEVALRVQKRVKGETWEGRG